MKRRRGPLQKQWSAILKKEREKMYKFNRKQFFQDLNTFSSMDDRKREDSAKEIGVSRVTFWRIIDGRSRVLSVELFFALCNYMGENPRKYVTLK